MIRAAFLSAGLNVALFGAGLLFVDDVQLSRRVTPQADQVLAYVTTEDANGRRHIQFPEWVPFTLMGLGGITMLYAIALPRG